MKIKPMTPYARLLADIKEWMNRFRWRHTVAMFRWAKKDLVPQNSWRMDDVYQRTLAAQSLGYEVTLTADEDGLSMKYRKSMDVPFQWKD